MSSGYCVPELMIIFLMSASKSKIVSYHLLVLAVVMCYRTGKRLGTSDEEKGGAPGVLIVESRGGREVAQNSKVRGLSEFSPKTVGERYQWYLYDLINGPAFSFRGGGDWGELRMLLDKDFTGTVKALSELDIEGGKVSVEIPIYLADYLADRPLKESARMLQDARGNGFLHGQAMRQLVVKVDDQGNRQRELLEFVAEDPHSPEAREGAEMIGLRLNDEWTSDQLEVYLNDLPSGSARESLFSGLVQQWSEQSERTEALLHRLEYRRGGFDQALAYHAGFLAHTKPERALNWARVVEDQDLQANTVANVLSIWGEEEPEAFASWLEEAGANSGEGFTRGVEVALNYLQSGGLRK